MYYDKLERQKRHVLKKRKVEFFLLSIILLFTALIFWAYILNTDKIEIIFLLLFCIALTAFQLHSIFKVFALIKQFDSIAQNNAINSTYEIRLYKPKISFIPESKIAFRYNSPYNLHYCGIVIHGIKKKKYYFYFDELYRLSSKEDLRQLEEKFYREITLQCYTNTNIVKTVENDPHFLRIRLSRII